MNIVTIDKKFSDDEVIDLWKNKDALQAEYDEKYNAYKAKEKAFYNKHKELHTSINDLHNKLRFLDKMTEMYEDQYPLKINYYRARDDGIDGIGVSSPLSHKRIATYFDRDINFEIGDDVVLVNYNWNKKEFLHHAKEFVAKGIIPK